MRDTQPIITDSLKLKAEAYQYQVRRFGNFYRERPLSKAVAKGFRSCQSGHV